MKERDYYITPKSNAIMRFLWKAAGGDKYLLEQATYSDQVKYMCLGGIVFATGAMAGLAGGYAFYTIFSPRGSALDTVRQKKFAEFNQEAIQQMTKDAIASFHTQEILVPILSIVFGIIWGLIIFNIDRFIVTSTGKGDGTEKITWEEFKGAIPRILMGAIIAITISKPVEIRMFKTEIDNKLYEKQLDLQKEFEKKTTANFEERLKVVEGDLGKVGEQRNILIGRLKDAEQAYTDNLMGKANGISAGNGPLSKALKDQVDAINNDLIRFDQINGDKIKDSEKKRKGILAEKDIALSKNVEVSNGLDGLVERIKLADEVSAEKKPDGTYGFSWISFFVTLLFMAIELTPVFFKLMLTKTPYDYLKENADELIKAESGIEVRYDYYKDKQGQERHLIINHDVERMIYEKIKVTDIQKELTDYAVEQYKQREKEKIDKNLDDYIKGINGDSNGSDTKAPNNLTSKENRKDVNHKPDETKSDDEKVNSSNDENIVDLPLKSGDNNTSNKTDDAKFDENKSDENNDTYKNVD